MSYYISVVGMTKKHVILYRLASLAERYQDANHLERNRSLGENHCPSSNGRYHYDSATARVRDVRKGARTNSQRRVCSTTVSWH